MRDKDANTAWDAASDATLEERRYYVQNWRADVVALLKGDGAVSEWSRYSAYGEATVYPFVNGDFDADGDVDGDDTTAFLADQDNSANAADVDRTGAVDGDDVTAFYASWDNGYMSTAWTAAGGLPSGAGQLSVTSGNRIGYAGYQFDPATEQYHVRHRVYSPEMGKWTRRDPLEATCNLLSYSDNSIRDRDPTGLRPIPFAFKAFIPGGLGGPLGGIGGTWIDGPVYPDLTGLYNDYYYETDNRTFAQPGTSRIQTIGSIESTLIGITRPRQTTFAGATTVAAVREWDGGYNVARTWTRIADVSTRVTSGILPCVSFITVTAAGNNPFLALSPDIDYSVTFKFTATGRSTVRIDASGTHDQFPAYEALFDGYMPLYSYFPPGPGPGLLNLSLSAPPFLASATVNAPTPYNCWSPLERMTRTGCYCLMQVGADCVCDEGQI